ncbi:MAG TPA: PCRF domain-containing protein, partial [Bacillota bacterium]|nr:PCRF domain-containing protein [Bacillota bacterium]
MFEKLREIEARYDELEREMADPEIIADQPRYKKVTKAHSDLEDIVARYRELKKVMGEIQSTREMLRDKLDSELRELAEA